jgi:peptidoglycan-N-acetylmuramic acid deacetylase PdaC-like protein
LSFNSYFCRIAAYLAAALIVLISLPAKAEDEKPALSVKTAYVEIEVSIAKELRTYPQLYSTLLADAKKYVDQNRKEAHAAGVANRPSYRDQPWTFDRSYRLRTAAGPYVSVLIDSGEFTGGAHPNSVVDTLLWDSGPNRRANMQTLFRETAKDEPTTTALAKLVRDAVIAEKKKRDIPMDDPASNIWLEPIKPDFSTLGAPSLAPSNETGCASGMTFHFSPYGVGAYAEGPYTLFVPFTSLEPYLTDDAKKLFAGERPKSDEDE